MRLKPLHLGMAALAGFGAYSLWWEPAMMMNVARYRVGLEEWRGRKPMRLVIISDLHAGWPHISLNRVSRIVDRANALKPDVAILLGDYSAAHPFTWGHTGKREIIQRLKAFTAPHGTYSVIGNHDWWQDAKAQLSRHGPVEAERELRVVGIPVLNNRSVRIGDEKTGFWLAGVDEQRPFDEGPDGEGMDDLEAALNEVTDDAPIVLLAHEPDLFDHLGKASRRVSLTISGHTHGGQIRVRGSAPLIMASDNEKWSHGRYDDEDGRALIVSAGIGCSVLPMRLGVPPELTVIELCEPDPETEEEADEAEEEFEELESEGKLPTGPGGLGD
ncbi:metallophosphoesterase (plasmid) [Paracoccus sp. TK19116]|uniref:Metallophosphoesterase n=1 Tax=Paracoccus albicereus TaxID=2922394 RepID=A0ABT1MLA1_9RHOB|nr:metallophosphoesterase [Paracoccus albicereus]MCQ0969067.1 metallophosphoesterase [Paracoccus albicereus]